MSRTADDCLIGLLNALRSLNYRFIPPTPETHRRVIARRPGGVAADVRDVFGWSLPFNQDALPSELYDQLRLADMIETSNGLFTSKVRVASMGDRLFLHSRYPTDAHDAVFLGPDSYRFVRFLRTELADIGPVSSLVDIGTGAGVGAIAAAEFIGDATIAMTDINPIALRFAKINARHAGLSVEALNGSGIAPVIGTIDVAIANPPFIADSASRVYRDGGNMHGAGLSLAWALAAAGKLSPGGKLLMYTGSAIIAGQDQFENALASEVSRLDCTLRYEVLDPDIFGEQLEEPGYEDVERIAAIGAVVTKASPMRR